MKKIVMVFALLLLTVNLSACSGKFWGGLAGGAAGAGTGYELRANQEMNRINKDLDAGRINQNEYNIRKDQIQRMSLTR